MKPIEKKKKEMVEKMTRYETPDGKRPKGPSFRFKGGYEVFAKDRVSAKKELNKLHERTQ